MVTKLFFSKLLVINSIAPLLINSLQIYEPGKFLVVKISLGEALTVEMLLFMHGIVISSYNHKLVI